MIMNSGRVFAIPETQGLWAPRGPDGRVIKNFTPSASRLWHCHASYQEASELAAWVAEAMDRTIAMECVDGLWHFHQRDYEAFEKWVSRVVEENEANADYHAECGQDNALEERENPPWGYGSSEDERDY